MSVSQPNQSNMYFNTFWMGGYECADHVNVHGDRVNMLALTSHLASVENDYELLQQFGIKSVREGICWSLTETSPYTYDFTHVGKMMDASTSYGIQQIWDICHFGYPSDITPFHPHFKDRFVALCSAFVKFYLSRQNFSHPLIVTPINEVSFISWLGGEVAGTSPFCRGKGWDVKYELMKAYIAGVAVMKKLYPEIRIMSTEPLVNIVPPLNANADLIQQAANDHMSQFQSNDMLCGRICRELGGKEEFLDIVGLNFYYNNQFAVGEYEIIPWLNENSDPRWRPLSELIAEVYQRYHRPIALAETSHSGEDRDVWIKFITDHCMKVLSVGIPLLGVCIYPIVDRPDWDETSYWHNSGLWGAISQDTNTREIDNSYRRSLDECQSRLGNNH